VSPPSETPGGDTPSHRWRSAGAVFGLVAAGLAVAALAPFLSAVDLFRRARLRVLVGRTPWTSVGSLALEGEALVVGPLRRSSGGTADRIPLDAIVALTTWQVTGDAGFADANTETYLVRVVLRDGTERRLVHRESYPHPFAAMVLAPLRSRGLALPLEVIAGPARGLGAVVIHGIALLWWVAATVVVHGAR
jgi:hypothetical protein